MKITCARPWIDIALDCPHRMLGWAVQNPGYVTADRILWREVRNADLPVGFDVYDWLDSALAARGQRGAVCMLTSRDVRAYQTATVQVGAVTAHAVATVGLSNAETVGARMPPAARTWGTINIAVITDAQLDDTAMLEAVSIATQARTAAVMDLAHDLATGRATGTGTDCITLACPRAAGVASIRYAGLHTEVGEATGRAVRAAVHAGGAAWKHALAQGQIGTGVTE